MFGIEHDHNFCLVAFADKIIYSLSAITHGIRNALVGDYFIIDATHIKSLAIVYYFLRLHKLSGGAQIFFCVSSMPLVWSLILICNMFRSTPVLPSFYNMGINGIPDIHLLKCGCSF